MILILEKDMFRLNKVVDNPVSTLPAKLRPAESRSVPLGSAPLSGGGRSLPDNYSVVVALTRQHSSTAHTHHGREDTPSALWTAQSAILQYSSCTGEVWSPICSLYVLIVRC